MELDVEGFFQLPLCMICLICFIWWVKVKKGDMIEALTICEASPGAFPVFHVWSLLFCFKSLSLPCSSFLRSVSTFISSGARSESTESARFRRAEEEEEANE